VAYTHLAAEAPNVVPQVGHFAIGSVADDDDLDPAHPGDVTCPPFARRHRGREFGPQVMRQLCVGRGRRLRERTAAPEKRGQQPQRDEADVQSDGAAADKYG
jgi:hypothetical protein